MNDESRVIDKWIGARIRQARRERVLSQTDLAVLLGKSQDVISKYEMGRVNISASTLFRLAQALNKPVSFFYPELHGSVGGE